MPSFAENPSSATVQTAFQLQQLVEAGHKNAVCVDRGALKVIKSITSAQSGKDAISLRTPEWANSKEGFQKKLSSFLDGLANNLEVKDINLSDDSDDSEEDPDWREGSEGSELEEEYDSEYDSDEYTESEDDRNTLDRISEDEDEDEDAEPKKCLDAKLGEGMAISFPNIILA